MKEKFILLTTTENDPIIIGISKIALVRTSKTDPETIVELNFAKADKQNQATILVKESFEEIKNKLGL